MTTARFSRTSDRQSRSGYVYDFVAQMSCWSGEREVDDGKGEPVASLLTDHIRNDQPWRRFNLVEQALIDAQ